MKKIIPLLLALSTNTNAGFNINYDKLYDTNSNEVDCTYEYSEYIKNELCEFNFELIKIEKEQAIIKTAYPYQVEEENNILKEKLKFFSYKYPHIDKNKTISNKFLIKKNKRFEKIDSSPTNKIYLYYFGKDINNKEVFKKVIYSEKYGNLHITIKK